MSKVIGIDLGTTFSAIASLDDLGNPEVLASIEDNRKITASAIYINGNNVIVGDKALNYIKNEPKKVILQTIREMENEVVYSVDQGKWTDDKGTEKYTTEIVIQGYGGRIDIVSAKGNNEELPKDHDVSENNTDPIKETNSNENKEKSIDNKSDNLNEEDIPF